jgi:ATP-dependent Lon protease
VGARGLRMILEDLMLEMMYHLPAQRKLRDFVVTAEMVAAAKSTGACSKRRDNRFRICPEANQGFDVQREKNRREARAHDAGAGHGHLPADDAPVHRGPRSSVRALEEALAGDKKIFLVTQHDASVDDPKPEEIYQVGTLANIVQSVKLPDGNIKVLVEGVERAKVVQVTSDEGFFRAHDSPGSRTRPSLAADRAGRQPRHRPFRAVREALAEPELRHDDRRRARGRSRQAFRRHRRQPADSRRGKAGIARNFDPLDRLNRIADILEVEIEKLNVDRNINTRVKRQMERAQKEYYLNEKLKAIQKELGRGEANEIEQLKKKIETSGMPEGPMEKALQELKRLEMMPPMSAESTVSRNYLDWLLAVPWKKRSKEIRDIKRAEKILSKKIITAWKKSKSASWNISPCASW